MRAIAISVHVLTATGAALALLAFIAAARGDFPLMLLWLGAALFVDGIDGPLARRFEVKKTLPRWSGDVLDLVVDFTTYVMVPAFAIATSGLMPGFRGIAAGVIITVVGALYFADTEMKTDDNHFKGFPAVWNLIAFNLLLLRPPVWVSMATVIVFAVLTFAPIRFVHPFRVVRLRALTVGLMVVWAVLAFAAVMQGLRPPFWITAALCLIAGYFLLIGLLPARREPT